jgi:hypothetical protein
MRKCRSPNPYVTSHSLQYQQRHSIQSQSLVDYVPKTGPLKVRSKLFAFASTLPAQTFDIANTPLKAGENISRRTNCAILYVLDPHWDEKYAPERSQLPFGIFYGN